ncbi:SprT-like domain-containing protein [Rubrivirga sp.]|uniref:SprT-like domain-containing protein n=1 Tax=Rubrivirga sp. TaxID=1885344 RepID=UPI003C76DE27
MPDLDDTRDLALRLMDGLGLEVAGASLRERGWTFGFDRARKRLGACHPNAKRITLSAHLTAVLPAEDVEDTVRHEIAHALDHELYPTPRQRRGRTAHDATWKALAARCGATPTRCFSRPLPDDPGAPYQASCPSCEAAHPLYREPIRARLCRACSSSSRPVYLRIVHRETERVIWPGGLERGAYGGTSGVTATCGGCGETVQRARRSRRPVACAACCSRHAGGRYDDRFRLRFA